MMKWAAMDPSRDEEPSLTLKLVKGTIVALDLDRFDEMIKEKGWSRYSPNIITGLLSNLVYDFSRKWSGTVIFGLDWKRGTEEAIIEIPCVEPIELKDDLTRIWKEINDVGGKITIIAIKDYIIGKNARSRREAYYGTNGRSRAIRLLRKLKRAGGNKVYIEN